MDSRIGISPVKAPIAILGVAFDNVTMTDALARIERMIASRRPGYVVTANVDFVVQAQGDVELHRILLDADLVICDGTPLVWASRILGNPLPERVAGADLVPRLIQIAADRQYRVFILGATPESAGKAVENLRTKYPALVVDHYSPRFKPLLEMEHAEIESRIRELQPDILLVSLGCPKQEKWIAMHYRSLGVPVSIGVGATVDFLAGQVKRAPRWMQRSGTEWIFRLLQEPRRLFARYARDLWVFHWKLSTQWWRLRAFNASLRGDPREQSPGGNGAVDAAHFHLRPEPTETPWQYVAAPERLGGAGITQWLPRVEEILAAGKHCVLELAHVSAVDSSGIASLIHLRKKLRAAGRQLLLLAPGRAVQRSLRDQRLQDHFCSVTDLATARRRIGSCRRTTAAPVSVRSVTPVLRLCWRGEITVANADVVWTATRSHILTTHPRAIAIDLADVHYLDTTGAGVMLRMKNLARSERADLMFIHARPAVRNVLHHTRLESQLLANADHRIDPPHAAGALILSEQT